jgi:hypothetical protein
MLDVHTPHHAAGTWRDFFIHIATICVGLLLAIGLEQSVEAVHRQRERNELRESLRRESDQVVHDCERVEPALTSEIQWHEQFADLLLKSSREHRPLGQVPPYTERDFDIPDDPVYLAAKASNRLELLTQQEVQAYGELDATLRTTYIAYQHHREALDSDQKTFGALPLSTPGLATDTNAIFRSPNALQNITLAPASLEELYKRSISVEVSSTAFRNWSRYVRGAALELQKGDRDLRQVQNAERQFDNLR